MTRKNTIQSVIDYLIDNGVSPMNADIILHLNHPAMGNEDMNIMRAAQENNWDAIWNFVDLYVSGDLT